MADRDAGPARTALPVSPLAASPAGLRVRLVRAAHGAFAGPFVATDGAASRVHLAEVTAEDGSAVVRFAWKLRRDPAPGSGHGGEQPRSNDEHDEHWARERNELARARGPHVVGSFPVPAALLASLPVVWCRRVDRFFTPVSPQTGRPLATCRDDAVLTAAGLPPYAQDVERWLHDGQPGSTVFVREHAGADVVVRPGVQVIGREELVRQWARLVRGDDSGAAADLAARWLPCVDCAHRRECYPIAPPAGAGTAAAAGALPAHAELSFVSFHDVEATALPWYPF